MKKEYVIILVVAALALVWYFFFRNKPATTTTTTMQTPGATVAAPVTQPAVINSPPSTTATATGASQTLTQPVTADVTARPSTGINPVGVTAVDSSQYDPVILPWINSFGAANKQHALDMYPQFTAAEKSMLVDFITNLWPGKRAQTATDTTNWNNWRMKYHILDGTYSPFDGAQDAYPGSNDFSAQEAYAPQNINPLLPVGNSQNAFTQKGASDKPYNGFKGKRKK